MCFQSQKTLLMKHSNFLKFTPYFVYFILFFFFCMNLLKLLSRLISTVQTIWDPPEYTQKLNTTVSALILSPYVILNNEMIQESDKP